MPNTVIPWLPQSFPVEIQNELNRRKSNRGLNYVNNRVGDWNNPTGEWSKYNGPMGSWVRITSNGVGYETGPHKNREGFIFYGGKDFYSDYGFSRDKVGTNLSTIGFQTDRLMTPHTLENDINGNSPIFVASPEIEKITVVVQKELFRKATIEWICFSKAQLEYMTPYFLVPRISCLIEWGWNHYNSDCMIDVTDKKFMKDIMNNPYQLYTNNILKSNGNYDVIRGIISDFDWSIDGNKIRCRTEILSPDRIYAGLNLDSTVEEIPNSNKPAENLKLPYGNLIDFVDNTLDSLKSIGDKTSELSHIIGFLSSTARPESRYNLVNSKFSSIIDFIRYLKKSRPNDWRTYLYGIFYGRDANKLNDGITKQYSNVNNDFDRTESQKNLWMNLGLVVEILNYHASKLKINNDCEMFKIDIDDILITGHPNMISSDGNVLLIPNKKAPKYFFGGVLEQDTNVSKEDYVIMRNSTEFPAVTPSSALSDLRLNKVCLQGAKIYRDDLDELINAVRYDNSITGSFEFPSLNDQCNSGYLKNLYINTSFIRDVAHDQDVKTYTNLIDKLLSGISAACGNYWDLRLIGSNGNPSDKSKQSTMKIVDYKFIGDDAGKPFTFNYMTDDSLLLSTSFKPTLSNAQAIRTIYASTNSTNSDVTRKLNNGKGELLDYKFKDRLFLSDAIKEKDSDNTFYFNVNETKALLKELQALKPTAGMFQMTTRDTRKNHINDVAIVRRLAMPNQAILNMLFDDSNFEDSTNYTGIMPGIQANFSLMGIGGLRTFMMFLVDGLPEPYSKENIIFRITDVTETLDDGKWITNITAGVIPLRNHIRKKLGLPPNIKS